MGRGLEEHWSDGNLTAARLKAEGYVTGHIELTHMRPTDQMNPQ